MWLRCSLLWSEADEGAATGGGRGRGRGFTTRRRGEEEKKYSFQPAAEEGGGSTLDPALEEEVVWWWWWAGLLCTTGLYRVGVPAAPPPQPEAPESKAEGPLAADPPTTF